jgi:hypothetical protein
MTEEKMQSLNRAAALGAAAWDGWAVRRDWLGGHEFVGYRESEDDARGFALVDQRLWVDMPGEVVHSVTRIDVVAYESHAGKLCTSPDCPQGTVVVGSGAVTVGEVR